MDVQVGVPNNDADLLPQKRHNVSSPIDTTPLLMNGKIVSKEDILRKAPFNINSQNISLPPNIRNLNMNPETMVTNNLPNFYTANMTANANRNNFHSDNEESIVIPVVYDESNPINSPPRTRPLDTHISDVNDNILHVKRIDLGSPPSNRIESNRTESNRPEASRIEHNKVETVPQTVTTMTSPNRLYESKAVDDQHINNVFVPRPTMEKIRNTVGMSPPRTGNEPRLQMENLRLQEPLKPQPYVKEDTPKKITVPLPVPQPVPAYTKPLEDVKQLQLPNTYIPQTVPNPVVPMDVSVLERPLTSSKITPIPNAVQDYKPGAVQDSRPGAVQDYKPGADYNVSPELTKFVHAALPVVTNFISGTLGSNSSVKQVEGAMFSNAGSVSIMPTAEPAISTVASTVSAKAFINTVIEPSMPSIIDMDNLNVLQKVTSPHRNATIKKKTVTIRKIVPRKSNPPTNENVTITNGTPLIGSVSNNRAYISGGSTRSATNQTYSPVYKIKADIFSDSDEEMEQDIDYRRQIRSPVRKVVNTSHRVKKIQPNVRSYQADSPIQSPRGNNTGNNSRHATPSPSASARRRGDSPIMEEGADFERIKLPPGRRKAAPAPVKNSTPIAVKTPTYMRNYKINTPLHSMSPKYQENPKNTYVRSGFKDTNYHYILSDANGTKKQYTNTTGSNSNDADGLNIPMPDYANMSPVQQARYHADFDSLFAEIAPDLGFEITKTGHDTPLEIRHALYDRYLTHYYVRAETWKYEICLGVISWCMEQFFDKYLLMPASGFVDMQSLHIRRYKKALYEIAKSSLKSTPDMEADPLQYVIKLTFISFAIHLFFSWVERMSGGIISLDPIRNLVTDFMLEDSRPEMGLGEDGRLPRPNKDEGGFAGFGGFGDMMGMLKKFTKGELDFEELINLGKEFFNNGPINVDEVDENPPNE